jgi:hypothetical protein
MRHAITGIDHCILLVLSLDAARSQYERLGFTVSARGLHPPDHGTGNHTLMFDDEYVELLGVVTPTPSNEHWRRTLESREGMSGLALQTRSADAAAAEMRADGVVLSDPANFSRPVVLPDGRKAHASFRTTQFPKRVAPGFHLFCCEHLSRETTWLPELLLHANTAYAIEHVVAVSDDPARDAAVVGRLFASLPRAESDGAFCVETGNAPIQFQTPALLAARHHGADLRGLNASGLVVLALKVLSAKAAEAALEHGDISYARTPAGIAVASKDACGALLVFNEA